MGVLGLLQSQDLTADYERQIGQIPYKINSILKRKYTYSSEQETEVIRILTEAVTDPITDTLKSLIQGLLDKLEFQVEQDTPKAIQQEEEKQQQEQTKKVAKNRVEQNATVAMKYHEPTFNDTKFSKIVDNASANNSLMEDYPNSYGFISDTGDFVKINRLTKSVCLVHSSGTRIVVDRNGNTTIFSTGSIKLGANGSMAIAVNGGLDLSATDGVYIHGKEVVIKSDGDLTLDGMKTDVYGAEVTFQNSAKVSAPKAQLEIGMSGQFGMMCMAAGFANGSASGGAGKDSESAAGAGLNNRGYSASPVKTSGETETLQEVKTESKMEGVYNQATAEPTLDKKYQLILQRKKEFASVTKPNSTQPDEGSTLSTLKLIDENGATLWSGVCTENIGASTDQSGQNKRIAPREYNLEWTSTGKNTSSALGKWKGKALWITCDDVLGRFRGRRILIHTGNYPQDTEGCLLPATSMGEGVCFGSTEAVISLFDIIDEIKPENVKLIVNEI